MKLIKQQEDMNIVPHEAMTVIARHNFGTPKDDIQVIKPMYKAYSANVTSYIGYDLAGLDGKWDKMEVHLSGNLVAPGMSFMRVTADTMEIWANGATSIGRGSTANSGWLASQGPRKLTVHTPNLTNGNFAFMSSANVTKTLEEAEFPETDKLVTANYMLATPNSRLYHVRFKSLKNLTTAAFMFWYARLDKPTVLHIRDLIMENEGTVSSLYMGIARGYSGDIEVQAALDDMRTKVRNLTVAYSNVPDDMAAKVYREPVITA